MIYFQIFTTFRYKSLKNSELFTPLAVTKGVVPEPSTISRYRIRKHATKEILQEKGMQKAPLHIKKYIENAIPYKKPVGRVNLAYV